MSGIILLGAGSFALVVADLAEELGHKAVACVINQGPWGPGDRHGNMPVYDTRHLHSWPDEGIQDFKFVSATIWPARAELIQVMLQMGYEPFSLIHSLFGSISTKALVGKGCVVCRGAVLESYSAILDHVIVNRGALIGHNVTVGRYATIGPGAILCGNVVVGPKALIGAGAMIKEGVTIGASAVVGMGAVVVRDVPPGATVKGNPAR